MITLPVSLSAIAAFPAASASSLEASFAMLTTPLVLSLIHILLEQFYASRSLYTRMRQKSVDLRKIVSTHLERSSKKLDLQLKQLKDTEKRDKYKVYGELLNTYGYQVTEGAKSVEVPNYYTGEMLTIPLDETLSPLDNAKKYFARYNKLKRTFEALNTQTEETRTEMAHLQTCLVYTSPQAGLFC